MQTQPNNLPKLVVFDCDSTIIQDEVIELIAEEAGTREQVAAITELAMRGEIDFKESLKKRVATLAGVPESVFERVIAKVRFTPGARELVQTIHQNGGYAAIVSGGFYEVLDALATDIEADVWHANRLEVVDGQLTGNCLGEIVDAEVKAQKLLEWAAKFGVAPADTVAVGDGANDILMMRAAATSVAFNAKPIVREVADHAITDDLTKAINLIY